MINSQEAEICKRRGHSRRPGVLWSQCDWCGTWFRYSSSVEQQREVPPSVQAEEDLRSARDQQMAELKAEIAKLPILRRNQAPDRSDS